MAPNLRDVLVESLNPMLIILPWEQLRNVTTGDLSFILDSLPDLQNLQIQPLSKESNATKLFIDYSLEDMDGFV